MLEIICAAIASTGVVIVAIIEARAGGDRKRAERRAAVRADESALSMELMSATCKLCVVTAKKVTHQEVNGDVEKAMESAEEAQRKYNKFIQCTAARQVVKQ